MTAVMAATEMNMNKMAKTNSLQSYTSCLQHQKLHGGKDGRNTYFLPAIKHKLECIKCLRAEY